ncbi:MAG: hypothetical protein AB7F99_05830 [Vicinamibacterales bacterium]
MDRSTVLNVVVFDSTQTQLVPGLTYWWRAGSTLARMAGRVDVVVRADDWTPALREIAAAVRSRSTPDCPARIGQMQFWGHGCDGAMLLAGRRLDTRSFARESPHRPLLDELRSLMDANQGSVWFRGCNTFRGDEGGRFAREAADFFGVPVVGHTFIIWALQSGTHILAPGETPGWSTSEGVRGRARRLSFTPWARSDSLWSAPFRPRTIPALRLAPPRG